MAKITTERREKTTYTLTSEELAHVLCEHLALTYSKNAKLTFAIRRGHDALGTTINLDVPNPITLTCETTTSNEPESPSTTTPPPVDETGLTPAEKKYRENQRIKNPDNDDAKLDLIAQALGLDYNKADLFDIEHAFEDLVAGLSRGG